MESTTVDTRATSQVTRRNGAKKGRPILVVDDDPSVRELVADVLEEAGYDVTAARDGEEAMRLIDDSPPRLLLLDIQMPNVDGPSLARELRSRLMELPVIVMTGRPHPEREADRCNAVAALGKPFDPNDLIRVVRRFAR
jgi:DNA-binding response OmpR family regulator